MDIPRNHGILGHAEVMLGLVEISVADTTEEHLDHHIFWSSLPGFDHHSYSKQDVVPTVSASLGCINKP